MNRSDPYRIYLLAQAGDGFAMSLVITLNLVYQVTVVGLDPLQLVLVGTTLEVSYFLFEIPTGIVADMYSRKWSVIIGFAMIGAGFVLEGSIPEFGAVLGAQVLFGIGATFTSGAYEAWVASETAPGRIGRGSSLGQVYLRGEQTHLLAALAAIGVAVYLGREDVSTPIVAGGYLLGMLALFLAFFMPEQHFERASARRRETWAAFVESMRTAYRVVRSRRALWLIVLVMFIWGGAAEGYDRLWTVHLIDGYDLPELLGIGLVGWFGIIRAGGMGLSILGAEIARRRIDTDSDYLLARTMLVLTVVIVVALVGLAYSPSFLFGVVAVWIVSGARNVLDPLLVTWVNGHSDEKVRATVLSGVRQAESLGEIAIGPGLGWIARIGTVATALASAAAVFGGSLFVWAKTLASDDPEPS